MINNPEDWVEDKEASAHFRARMLVPKGSNFEKAQAKIYAVARFNPSKQPISDFMPDAIKQWRDAAKDAKISTLADLPRGDGKPAFQHHQFEARSLAKQGYELQAVTTDTDTNGNSFIVTITLSANSQEALKAAEPAYLAILRKY